MSKDLAVSLVIGK